MARIKIQLTPDQLQYVTQQKAIRRLQSREKRKALKKAINNSGWKKFEGEMLPTIAWIFKSKYSPEGHEIFRYGGGWVEAYYKGDNPETATEWIVVTDNGGSYKVGAYYMLWHPGGSQALWSTIALKKSIKKLLTEGVTVPDPGYQT